MANLCLSDLEDWEPGEGGCKSHLAGTCAALAKKPFTDFEVEDYRIMISQNLGTVHLLPGVLEILWDRPMAEGDYYPGDLLFSVQKIPIDFWRANENLRSKFVGVLNNFIKHMDSEWEKRRAAAKKNFGADLTGDAVAEGQELALLELAREFLR